MTTKPSITNQRDLRRRFWEEHPQLQRRKIKDYAGTGRMHVTDTRVAWCDFVDMMGANGEITQELAQRATLVRRAT